MNRFVGAIALTGAVIAGAAVGYWYARSPTPILVAAAAPQAAAGAAERKVLYYRDPGGAPYWSAEPKKDASGRDYIPVYEDEEPEFGPGGELKKVAARSSGPRKILYYRNPMGLPDTSPVPKKDWMGMDYIPVYEGEEQDDGKTVKVSLDKIQRTGVRTELIEPRVVVRPVRAVGTVKHDDSRLTIVTMRSDGYIEDLFVNRTGQHVRAGEPLFRVYSSDIVQAQIDMLVSMGVGTRGLTGSEPERQLNGAMQRLRNLGVPEDRIREMRETKKSPRTIDWLSPATGDVI